MGEEKLTKQQKRDAKRNLQVKQGIRQPKKKNKKEKAPFKSHPHTPKNSAADTAKAPQEKESARENKLPGRIPRSWGINLPCKRMLCETDDRYGEVLKIAYSNFAIEDKDLFSTKFHDKFQSGLQQIDDLYDFDIIQPLGLGTPLAMTKVQRCLVGAPGITYKYLGLRMFSYPFDGDKRLKLIEESSIALQKRTAKLLESSPSSSSSPAKAEGHDYDIVLINKCLPPSEDLKLKPEPTFKNQNVLQSVSWHADSMLKNYSSIAVYNWVPSSADHDGAGWKIGLRVEPHSEGPSKNQKGFALSSTNEEQGSSSEQAGKDADSGMMAPPLTVALPNESVYYLLDDFNHHHQHAVFAGREERYSSTHRVARQGHTYQSIRGRVLKCLNRKLTYDAKNVRLIVSIFAELEGEWLRQWYIQGKQHEMAHTWWHRPIAELLDLHEKLEDRLTKCITVLQDPSSKEKHDAITPESVSVMVAGLSEVVKLRAGWAEREKEPIFARVDRMHQPTPFPRALVDYSSALQSFGS